jgi:hypothetical protein
MRIAQHFLGFDMIEAIAKYLVLEHATHCDAESASVVTFTADRIFHSSRVIPR